MQPPLFRQQALDGDRAQSVGAILLIRPVPIRIAAWTSLLLTAILLSYLCSGHYTRKVRVTGKIIPTAGALTIVAPQFGRVIARQVQDGDPVLAGQVLYEL